LILLFFTNWVSRDYDMWLYFLPDIGNQQVGNM